MDNGPNMFCSKFPLIFPELFTRSCRRRLTNSHRKEFPDGHWNSLFPRKRVNCQDELMLGSMCHFLKFSDSFLPGVLQLPFENSPSSDNFNQLDRSQQAQPKLVFLQSHGKSAFSQMTQIVFQKEIRNSQIVNPLTEGVYFFPISQGRYSPFPPSTSGKVMSIWYSCEGLPGRQFERVGRPSDQQSGALGQVTLLLCFSFFLYKWGSGDLLSHVSKSLLQGSENVCLCC